MNNSNVINESQDEICWEVYRGPCPCGEGEVVVEVCRPDVPYPQTKRYKGIFSCEACDEKYQVAEQDTDILLVEKSEVDHREKLLTQWHEACEELMVTTKVLKILRQFKEYLAEISNTKELCEIFREAEFIHGTDQEFEEEYDNPKSWVKHHIRVSHLPKVMELIHTEDPELCEKVKSLEEIWKSSKAPLDPVGGPLFKKYPY